MARTALKVVLAVFGALVLFTAINRAFGGIATLGWQGPTDFFAVNDAPGFAIHDSHTRFLGGVWAAVGLAFLAASIWLDRLRPVLLFLCAAIFVGGLARFSSPDIAVLFGPGVAVSLALEILLMPLLAFWLLRGRRH